MRSFLLSMLAAALGLATVVSSVPVFSSTPDDCAAPSTETVFLTASASSPQPSTVYVTVPVSSVEADLSEVPTGTSTRIATLYNTVTAQTVADQVSIDQSSAAGQLSDDPSQVTVTQTSVVIITNVNITPIPSGGSVTYTETPAPNGLLNYVVENGTTYWLDGQTPAPSGPYVFSTTSVTVIPLLSSASPSGEESSTVTLHRTIFLTQQLTLTETLDSASSSLGAVNSASIGTGLPYTKSSGGWNATKTATGVLSGTTNAFSASSAGGILVSSSLAAQSGFTASIADPGITSAYGPAIASSSASGNLTTAIINGQTITWGGSSSTTCTDAPYNSTSARVPYENSTSAIPVQGSNTASGIVTGLFPTSTGAPYENSTSATSVQSSGAASGIVTGLLPTSARAPYGNSTSVTSVQSSGAATGIVTGFSSTSAGAPYGNSTSATSAQSSNTASGIVTGFSSASAGAPYENSTFVTSVQSSGAASGIVTGLSSTPSSSYGSSSAVVNLTTSVSSASGTPSLLNSLSLGGSSTVSPAIANSTVLGGFTSLGSSSSTSVNSSYSSPLTLSTSSSMGPTYTSSTASASPTKCGEQGDFVLNFDDIPPLGISNKTDPNTVQPEPVFNPYHQFDFSDGFTVVPPPSDPYLPSSRPFLTMFIPNFNINGTNTQAGPNTAEEGYSGQISDGDFDLTGCFRFNMYGASFGCDSTGPDCVFSFSGYQLGAARKEILAASQNVVVPACKTLTDLNCNLTSITLDDTFQNLAFVRINVTVAEQPKLWWMDDLRLGWFNNTCAAGLCRQTTHIH